MIRATLVYIFIGLYVLILAPPAMFWTFIVKDTRLLYVLARFCIRTAGYVCGIRVSIEGRENVAAGKTYLFLSNHQGNFDGPVLSHAIPRNWKALIKKEIMRLPLLSLVLRQAQFVPIERLNPKQARMGIEQGASLLSEGNSFIAFPEGTRSRDGRLGEFKKGAFVMAIKAQIPIMPVTIIGSAAIQPPGSYAIRSGRIRVIFHDPIPTEGMDLESRNYLIERTRQVIASGLAIEG
jgi:1-acyl-sn-glycerol-3-phosphate acyltransferase